MRAAISDAIATCERRIAEERGAIALLEARGADPASGDLAFAKRELAHEEALLGRLLARKEAN